MSLHYDWPSKSLFPLLYTSSSVKRFPSPSPKVSTHASTGHNALPVASTGRKLSKNVFISVESLVQLKMSVPKKLLKPGKLCAEIWSDIETFTREAPESVHQVWDVHSEPAILRWVQKELQTMLFKTSNLFQKLTVCYWIMFCLFLNRNTNNMLLAQKTNVSPIYISNLLNYQHILHQLLISPRYHDRIFKPQFQYFSWFTPNVTVLPFFVHCFK